MGERGSDVHVLQWAAAPALLCSGPLGSGAGAALLVTAKQPWWPFQSTPDLALTLAPLKNSHPYQRSAESAVCLSALAHTPRATLPAEPILLTWKAAMEESNFEVNSPILASWREDTDPCDPITLTSSWLGITCVNTTVPTGLPPPDRPNKRITIIPVV